jgi:hypothetical protein
MNSDLEELIRQFNEVGRQAQTLAFLPRAQHLQEEACRTLRALLHRLKQEKAARQRAKDELASNTILALELTLTAGLRELEMWIALKNDQPEVAWNHMVDAQQQAESALTLRRWLKHEKSLDTLENYIRRLYAIEQIVFPPQIYSSFGGTIAHRECSICGSSYEACPHIKGRAYMGEPCYTILKEIDLVEVSVVTDPANKRARVTHFSDGGKMRNKMTWELEDRGAGPETEFEPE